MDGLGLDDGTYDLVTLIDGTVLQIHGPARCAGEVCPFHNPSDHPLKAAPIGWLRPINLMVRFCRHDRPHVDPDSYAWWKTQVPDLPDLANSHTCCPERCCGVSVAIQE